MFQHDVEARTTLRDGLATLAAESSQPPDVRHGSIEALAQLRDARAVPRLIPLLSSDYAAISRSAHWALVTLAVHDFAYDAAAWNNWWEKNRDRHRVEWLIDGLLDPHVEIRRSAGEELKALSHEHFGYYEDLPQKDRERAYRAYREWWERTGRAQLL
jgi:HEAT repeat protein